MIVNALAGNDTVNANGVTVNGNEGDEFKGGLNHIAVVVDDLDAVEKKAMAKGFTTHSHANYEPGRRFCFNDHDGIEFEVVSYS